MVKSKDIPLSEINLRKYPFPSNTKNKRDIVSRFCMAVGLLRPGDSRDVIVDILHVLLRYRELDFEDLIELIKKNREKFHLPIVGIAESNIRRQLRRLKEMFLIEKHRHRFRIRENESLHTLYKEHIMPFVINPIISRLEEYFKFMDAKFKVRRIKIPKSDK